MEALVLAVLLLLVAVGTGVFFLVRYARSLLATDWKKWKLQKRIVELERRLQHKRELALALRKGGNPQYVYIDRQADMLKSELEEAKWDLDTHIVTKELESG